jgi:parallel beta-helix repeat protein
MVHRKFLLALVAALCIALFSSPAPSLVGPVCSASLNSSNPILIDGDNNFTSANGVVGGSGTDNDPYIIENWVISASSNHGIHIKNTRSYFVIRNVVVENGYPTYNGIYFENVWNGKIENVVSMNNGNGIFLIFSNANTVLNSTVGYAYYGITLGYSHNNTFLNNTLGNNKYGFWLASSTSNTLSGNIVENCTTTGTGIVLNSSSSNTISNNTVGNNPNGIPSPTLPTPISLTTR